jgi:hypothetical protein
MLIQNQFILNKINHNQKSFNYEILIQFIIQWTFLLFTIVNHQTFLAVNDRLRVNKGSLKARKPTLNTFVPLKKNIFMNI